MSISRLGVPCSTETKLKISVSKKNNPMSQEARAIISASNKKRIGALHPRWNGGITDLREAIRKCVKYTEWRTNIFDRDSFTCETCKEVGGKLEAHHIKRFADIIQENNITSLEQALACSELWDTNNGITLCKECHDKTTFK